MRGAVNKVNLNPFRCISGNFFPFLNPFLIFFIINNSDSVKDLLNGQLSRWESSRMIILRTSERTLISDAHSSLVLVVRRL